MPLGPTLGRQRKSDLCELEISLGFTMGPCLKQTSNCLVLEFRADFLRPPILHHAPGPASCSSAPCLWEEITPQLCQLPQDELWAYSCPTL